MQVSALVSLFLFPKLIIVSEELRERNGTRLFGLSVLHDHNSLRLALLVVLSRPNAFSVTEWFSMRLERYNWWYRFFNPCFLPICWAYLNPHLNVETLSIGPSIRMYCIRVLFRWPAPFECLPLNPANTAIAAESISRFSTARIPDWWVSLDQMKKSLNISRCIPERV